MQVLVGDITGWQADAIVNAANGLGPMGGGVAGALRRAGGQEIEEEAVRVCRELDPEPGDVYVTSAGRLKARWLLHAVTMKRPAEPSSLEIVRRCLRNVLETARVLGVQSLVLPALGTGVGRVPRPSVALIFYELLVPVRDLQIAVVDRNEEFIGYLRDFIERSYP
ncbi:MAG: macro domain-containing protein [Bacillota bacterium]